MKIPIWPWSKISRLESEIVSLKSTIEHERAVHRIIAEHHNMLKDTHENHKSFIRSFAIASEKKQGLIPLLLIVGLSCFGQPITRKDVTTNSLSLTVSNVSGGLFFDATGLTLSSNVTAHAVSQGLTLGATSGAIEWLWFHPTNVTVVGTYPGFFIGADPNATDGNLVFIADTEKGSGYPGSPFKLNPYQILTNTTWMDSFIAGHPPGWQFMKTNTTSRKAQVSDSAYVGVAMCPNLTFLDASSIQDGFGTLIAMTNCEGSAIFSAFMPVLLSSTNDALFEVNGANYTRSKNNTFLGFCLPNSTHGDGNTVIGSGVDLPVDGNNNQLNIGNLLWGTGLNQNGNTAASGVLTVNNRLEAQILSMPTNYIAANWTPISGKGFFVMSNNACYFVTNTKTNLIASP